MGRLITWDQSSQTPWFIGQLVSWQLDHLVYWSIDTARQIVTIGQLDGSQISEAFSQHAR
jgi:hypothetical protein